MGSFLFLWVAGRSTMGSPTDFVDRYECLVNEINSWESPDCGSSVGRPPHLASPGLYLAKRLMKHVSTHRKISCAN